MVLRSKAGMANRPPPTPPPPPWMACVLEHHEEQGRWARLDGRMQGASGPGYCTMFLKSIGRLWKEGPPAHGLTDLVTELCIA